VEKKLDDGTFTFEKLESIAPDTVFSYHALLITFDRNPQFEQSLLIGLLDSPAMLFQNRLACGL